MTDLKQTAQSVLEENKELLAGAKTEEAVEELLPTIARQIEQRWDPRDDRWAYMAVIGILGVVLVVVSYTYMRYALTPDTFANGAKVGGLRDLPDALIALGSAAIGALAGLLAPTPRK